MQDSVHAARRGLILYLSGGDMTTVLTFMIRYRYSRP